MYLQPSFLESEGDLAIQFLLGNISKERQWLVQWLGDVIEWNSLQTNPASWKVRNVTNGRQWFYNCPGLRKPPNVLWLHVMGEGKPLFKDRIKIIMPLGEISLIEKKILRGWGSRVEDSRVRCCGVSKEMNSEEGRKTVSHLCHAGIWNPFCAFPTKPIHLLLCYNEDSSKCFCVSFTPRFPFLREWPLDRSVG